MNVELTPEEVQNIVTLIGRASVQGQEQDVAAIL